jgi:hypothetical protein
VAAATDRERRFPECRRGWIAVVKGRRVADDACDAESTRFDVDAEIAVIRCYDPIVIRRPLHRSGVAYRATALR